MALRLPCNRSISVAAFLSSSSSSTSVASGSSSTSGSTASGTPSPVNRVIRSNRTR